MGIWYDDVNARLSGLPLPVVSWIRQMIIVAVTNNKSVKTKGSPAVQTGEPSR